MKNKLPVISFINKLAQRLTNRNTKQRSLQYAWWMLEAVTKKNRAALLASDCIDLTEQQANTLNQWIEDHINKHKPLPYILGWVPFGPLHILVKPPILIPRPETEEWTLKLASELQHLNKKNLSILDICTGSGCIGLTLASLLPRSHVWASDINTEALELAKKNALHNGISNITFIHSDLFNSIPHGTTFDIIVSNPPYIDQGDWASLDTSVVAWEDKQALIANEKGYELIQKIITQAPQWLKKDKLYNKDINNVYIELADKQAHNTADFFKQAGYTNIIIEKDIFGRQRMVSGTYIKS